MALVFTKELAPDKWLLSDNNNIIQFTDDVTSRTILYADFTVGIETPSRVYADPNGVIWYNVRENVSARLNDYDDTLDFNNITPSDINTFFLNSDKNYLSYTIAINVVFTNAETLAATTTSNFLLGVEQTEDFFKGVTIKNKDIAMLSPLKDNTNTRSYLNYWEGYPFDVGFTRKISDSTNITTIQNLSTGQTSPTFSITNIISRLVFSNGTTNITIEDHLPLGTGLNILQLDANTQLEINKIEATCGSYIKWLNQYGGFNYWLFATSSRAIRTRDRGTINNDFNNIEDSVSERRSLGRDASEQLTVFYENLNDNDIRLLKGMIQSPKIYLYMGERYTPRALQNWIEITLPNKNMDLNNFRNRVPNGTIVIDLPPVKTIAL